MALLQMIKVDNLIARRDRATIKANLLSTLYSEASMVGKNKGNRESTDEEVIAVVTKFVKNLEETKEFISNNPVALNKNRVEFEILQKYLPTMLTEVELTNLIGSYISEGNTSVGAIMGKLKQKYAGKYDGKVASDIAKKLTVGGGV